MLDRLRSHSRLVLVLILVLTFTAYARTLSFAFVYDDHVQVIIGPSADLDLGWEEILTRDEWAHIAGTASNYYRPVMPLWRKLIHYWFDADPLWWHFASIVLHLVATCLVYGLALHLLKDRFGAAIAGAVFGLHPTHVESVAWVTGSVDSLVTVWFLGCLLCHLSAQATSGFRRYLWLAAALLFFGLSMLTKETALVMAGVVFAHQWSCGEPQATTWRRFRTAFIASAPYAILTIVYLVIRITVRGGLTVDAVPVSLSTMVLTWPSLLWFYISHLVWPVGLSEFYDFPYVIGAQFKEFVLPLLGVALVGGTLVWWGIRVPTVMFASAWMLFPLLPALNLSVLPHGDFVHDRFLYLPSVGYALLPRDWITPSPPWPERELRTTDVPGGRSHRPGDRARSGHRQSGRPLENRP